MYYINLTSVAPEFFNQLLAHDLYAGSCLVILFRRPMFFGAKSLAFLCTLLSEGTEGFLASWSDLNLHAGAGFTSYATII